MAVIAALAITILVKIGPARYSAAVLSPASSPNQPPLTYVYGGVPTFGYLAGSAACRSC